jgi:hypothetical protein
MRIGPTSFGYTTWAPRGIFSTKSTIRGRNARNAIPVAERTTVPSGESIRRSCGSPPPCECHVSPAARRMR